MPSSNDNKYKRNDVSKAKTKKNKKKKNKVLKVFINNTYNDFDRYRTFRWSGYFNFEWSRRIF